MRIALASVLKPVTDPRLLARLGRTLAELPGAEVHILAHVATDARAPRPDTERPNVFLHPIFNFPRLSLARALAGRTLSKYLRRIHPDILVVGAAELLPAGLRWQRETGGKLVYDVRENYALNVRTQGVFPPAVAAVLATRLERVEAAAAPHLAGVLLAERVYAAQLPWLTRCRNVVIIENKYQPPTAIPAVPLRAPVLPVRSLRLLISGTLNELYGTFDAIEAVQVLRASQLASVPQPAAELLIVGHAPQPADAVRLRALAAERPWLHLTGIEHSVPHSVIIDAVRRADIGLLPYRAHPSLTGCVPTKVWEYVAEGLPVVATDVNDWCKAIPELSEIEGRGAFVMFSNYFDSANFAASIAHAVSRASFAPPLPAPTAAFWTTEAPRLYTFFSSLR